jgi:DNA modification methylase
LRNEIIWHKPSCLPASVKDRYTVDFEKMFFFTKNPKYYFKQQIEPVKDVSLKRAEYGLNQTDNSQKAVNVQDMKKMGTRFVNPNGRNKRTVWHISTASFKDAHFAVYPPELLESPIDAGCPRFVDKVTKKPREVVLEKSFGNPVENVDHKSQNAEDWRKIGKSRMNKGKYPTGAQYVEKGYTDNRDDSEFEPGIVLDPFFGSGTTAQVAMEQDKDWVGIELNSDYEKISQKRLKPKIVEKKTRDLANKFWDTK